MAGQANSSKFYRDRFLDAVANLLERRQKRAEVENGEKHNYKNKRSEGPRRWTWEELYLGPLAKSHEDEDDTKFSWLKDMKNDRIKRRPNEWEVNQLADFMCATFEERNELLFAAGYAIHSPYIQGEQLKVGLEIGKKILEDLPYPAVLITRGDNIHGWNKYASKLYNITEEEEQELKKTMERDGNVLMYISDPENPVYRVLTNKGENDRWQKYTLIINIYRFKLDNFLCRYDNWYKKVEADLREKIGTMWDAIDIDTGAEEIKKHMPEGMVFPEYVTHLYTDLYTDRGIEFCIRGFQIDYTGWGYPKILAYTYNDDKSREIFTDLDLPTPDNKWGKGRTKSKTARDHRSTM